MFRSRTIFLTWKNWRYKYTAGSVLLFVGFSIAHSLPPNVLDLYWRQAVSEIWQQLWSNALWIKVLALLLLPLIGFTIDTLESLCKSYESQDEVASTRKRNREWISDLAMRAHVLPSLLFVATSRDNEVKNRLSNILGADEATRQMLYNSLIDMATHGLSKGANIVDVKVDKYVKYISRVVKESRDIRMTCTVRPYWFVTNEIQGVSLPPYKSEKDQFGKAEHLSFFQKPDDGSHPHVRYLVVDEHMLAEMLLTVWIDMKVGSQPKIWELQKWVSTALSKCMISLRLWEDILPEIKWFREEVNEDRGVRLYYTIVKRSEYHAGGKDAPLADRVYAHDLVMDVRFNFTSLEEGILRIRSKETGGCQALLKVEEQHFVRNHKKEEITDQLNVENGKSDSSNGHAFYRTFRALLKYALDQDTNVRKEMVNHLEYLKSLVKQSKTRANEIYSRLGLSSQSDYETLADKICEAADELKKVLDVPKPAGNVIQQIQAHFRGRGISETVWIVVPDYDFPVRRATWRQNWQQVLKAK